MADINYVQTCELVYASKNLPSAFCFYLICRARIELK